MKPFRIPPLMLAAIAVVFVGCGSEPPAKTTPRPAAASKSPPEEHRKSDDEFTPNPLHNVDPIPRKEEPVPDPVVKASTPNPAPVFRPSDDRPRHDAAALAKLGIRKYESKRLLLYTDVNAATAKTLLPLLDQAYAAWEAYFGQLPSNRERTPFQVTGYVIKDKALFRDAKLIPGDLPPIPSGGGRHRGYEFWMYAQPWDYYRRHLAVHEATHCYMYATRDVLFPTWYMEGMAEFFGTHEVVKAESGKPALLPREEAKRDRKRLPLRVVPPSAFVFGVMPGRFEDFVGSGRIEFIQQDCAAGRPLSLKEVVELKPKDYLHNQAYAWSWALCKFLDSHPRYGKRFRELRTLETATAFRDAFAAFIRKESPQIFSEWSLFAHGLVYGYDTARAAIAVRPGKPVGELKLPLTFDLQTNRGWQSTGVWLDKGDTLHITAAGRFELARKPKPWISEPQGISFTYFQGRPLGEVTAVVVPDSPRSLPITVRSLPLTPIGRGRVLRAAIKGTVYLRVNDSFAWLGDNTGVVRVTVGGGAAMRGP